MKVIGFMVDFLKIIKLWDLSIEFYGEWQLFATHHTKNSILEATPTAEPL